MRKTVLISNDKTSTNQDNHAPALEVYSRPSKSQKKREIESFRDLAVELVGISPGRFARLDIPDNIRSALDVARRMTNHAARRRQLSYLAGLLQEIDVASVRNAITHGDQLVGNKTTSPASSTASPLKKF